MILMHGRVLEPLNESKKGKEMCREELRDRGTWLMTGHGFQEVTVKEIQDLWRVFSLGDIQG